MQLKPGHDTCAQPLNVQNILKDNTLLFNTVARKETFIETLNRNGNMSVFYLKGYDQQISSKNKSSNDINNKAQTLV